ncbi:N-acetylglucosaminyl-phosphatidylinositol de-N-acetylase [Tieghemiomyces parasiticus]|uniref:N-acetylglucosaminylphosphatidylinositol deacetylase n=1 Tax=Tieghemiomyces parasiticus TaxID=78921 RepID=A0A9W7ZWV5_9FUNG|nr:N-acetylglucosaminyl-phosphatidylinositol de-N-acetylase [Tieghemiomyces parasiticus]
MILGILGTLCALFAFISTCTYTALVFFPPRLSPNLIPVNPAARPLAAAAVDDTTGASTATDDAHDTTVSQRTTGDGEKAPLVTSTGSLRRVLLVIAHPDDECMFFGPLLTALQRWQSPDPTDPVPRVEVHVLCMSVGNFDKQGEVRQVELVRSCARFGIAKENIIIVDDPSLPDNPNKVWNIQLVARIIEKCVVDRGIGSIFTFDQRGVSGHMNHIAVNLGVQHMLGFSRRIKARSLPAYRLVSVGLLRKYASLFDTFFSLSVTSQPELANFGLVSSSEYLLFVAHWRDVIKAREAMYEHRSQMLWFRHLYIFFSRYMVINSFERVR